MDSDGPDDSNHTNTIVNNCEDKSSPVEVDAVKEEDGRTPCCMCGRRDELPECPRKSEETPVNHKPTHADEDLDTLRAFDLKVRLTSSMCQCCWTHLRLLTSAKRSDADAREPSASFCQDDCLWLSTIAGLPSIEAESTSPTSDQLSTLQRTFDRVKVRLHHQALIELSSKALPDNLQLPPIKSYDELSNFFNSRISLSPTAALADLKSPAKKPVRQRRSKSQPKSPKRCSTPVVRISRETTRLRELDCSYLDIIFRHPDGYSPHSILVTPDRSLNRSSKSVSFSTQTSFIERLAYDNESDGSDGFRRSRSPGSPVPKRRKIEHEAHPNKLSPKKSPAKAGSPAKPSAGFRRSRSPGSPLPKRLQIEHETQPNKLAPKKSPAKAGSPTKPSAGAPSKQNGTKKPGKAPKNGKSPAALTTKKQKMTNTTPDKPKAKTSKKPTDKSPPKKSPKPNEKTPNKTTNGKTKSKSVSPADDVFRLKISSLLHARRKSTAKRSTPKRLQSAYLRKKFGRRPFRSHVRIARIVDMVSRLAQVLEVPANHDKASTISINAETAETDTQNTVRTVSVSSRNRSPAKINDPVNGKVSISAVAVV